MIIFKWTLAVILFGVFIIFLVIRRFNREVGYNHIITFDENDIYPDNDDYED